MKNKGFQKVLRWLIAFLVVIYPFSPLSNNLLVSNAADAHMLSYQKIETENMGTVTAIRDGEEINTDTFVLEGEEVTLTAIPQEGYVFYKWEGIPDDLVKDIFSPEVSFMMPANDLDITARFIGNVGDSETQLDIFMNPEGVGTVSGTAIINTENGLTEQPIDSVGTVSLPAGSFVSLNATAEPGYDFSGWEVNEDAVVDIRRDANAVSFYIGSGDPVIATATFAETEPILTYQSAHSSMGTVTATADGAIKQSGNPIVAGTLVELEAKTNGDHKFDRWEFSNEFDSFTAEGNKVSFEMPEYSLNVTAYFKAYFTLAVDPQEGGVVKDANGDVIAPGIIPFTDLIITEAEPSTGEPNCTSFTAEPNPGYRFKNWVLAFPEGFADEGGYIGWSANLTNPSPSIQLDQNNFLNPNYSGFTLTAVFEKEAEDTVVEPTTDSKPTDTTFPKTSDELNVCPYIITMMLSAGMYFLLKNRVEKSNKKAGKA